MHFGQLDYGSYSLSELYELAREAKARGETLDANHPLIIEITKRKHPALFEPGVTERPSILEPLAETVKEVIRLPARAVKVAVEPVGSGLLIIAALIIGGFLLFGRK